MKNTIKNKLESDKFIIESGMNYTPFTLVKNISDLHSWSWTPTTEDCEPFSIRFKGVGMQPFVPNLTKLEVILYCRDHFLSSGTPLGIYEATEHYDLFRVSNAEIRINSDMTVDGKYCVGSLKMRDALNSKNAVNIVKGSLFNRRYRWAVEYCLKFGVIGKVVELTLFSKKVGVRNDFVVCWEVRDF